MLHFSKLAAAILLGSTLAAAAGEASLSVKLDQPGIKVSPTLYGIFFEEINRAGEGGIYAEMLQNRSFEDSPAPVAWTLLKTGPADATLTLDKTNPLNPNNPTSLRIQITQPGGRVGVANQGYKGARWSRGEPVDRYLPRFEKAAAESTSGLAIESGKDYALSLYARAAKDFTGPLTLTLEKQDGTPLARQTIDALGESWKKHDLVLRASATDPNARLVVAANTPGTFWLDMVSLFPKDTFKNHPNGIRRDLGQFIADMKPAFVRFPGGCYVEGEELAHASRWKKSIGDIAQRPGHWNLWGYYSSDGLGYHEYLQFCEDLGAEPLFVINCGMAHKDNVPMDQMHEYVQDALDAIEYANGSADSQWGALRAKAGHPAPFNLKYMEIGNENGGKLYDERYALFYDAIKAKYPNIKLIANHWGGGVPSSRKVEIADEHYYNNPTFFMSRAGMYDSYDRQRYQVYVGEYAVTQGCGQGNLIAALGEAAYMTGLERNSDVVVMASYAPLLVHPAWRGWNPNAIVFDAARLYGTPSYHVQAMFGANRADTILPTTVTSTDTLPPTRSGMIGVATWATQAEFKDIKVVGADGKVLFQSDFSKDLKPWKTYEGTWELKDGALRQTGNGNGVRALVGDTNWTDYTLTLKARKLGGAEGFLILFQNRNTREKHWWNIGGWGNQRHALECEGLDDASVNGRIETGRWYDLKVQITGPSVRCYLDGKLIHDVTRHGQKALYAVAGLSADRRQAILKVVNTSADPMTTTLSLQGAAQIAPTASALVLSGASPDDENSFDTPTRIAPKQTTINNLFPSFRHTFPPLSVTILRMDVQNK